MRTQFRLWKVMQNKNFQYTGSNRRRNLFQHCQSLFLSFSAVFLLVLKGNDNI